MCWHSWSGRPLLPCQKVSFPPHSPVYLGIPFWSSSELGRGDRWGRHALGPTGLTLQPLVTLGGQPPKSAWKPQQGVLEGSRAVGSAFRGMQSPSCPACDCPHTQAVTVEATFPPGSKLPVSTCFSPRLHVGSVKAHSPAQACVRPRTGTWLGTRVLLSDCFCRSPRTSEPGSVSRGLLLALWPGCASHAGSVGRPSFGPPFL